MTESTGIQAERNELRARGMKKCLDCAEVKPLSEFYLGSVSGSYQPCCKPCGSKRVAKWKAANPERARTMHRRGHLMREYGLSMEQFNEMFVAQKGCCAICLKHASEMRHGLVVDHSHSTNRVRGLLCRQCNTGLGKLGDEPESIRAVLAYLEKDGAP